MQKENSSKVKGSLHGKVAVITGAARGIGRAAAIAMAREGADIFGIDICSNVFAQSGVDPSTPQDLNMTGELVKEAGGRWLSMKLDQRDFPLLRTAALKVEEAFGGIDILFANAGIQGFKPLLEMEDIDWQIHMDINLTGTANAIRAFAPHLVKRGGGRIIVTASTQGRHGMKNGSAYSASKWGIIGLMKSAALELGPYGITVNAIVPGLIDTKLTRHQERYIQALQDADKETMGNIKEKSKEEEEKAKQILSAKSPLGVPWIDPMDVAPVVVFLASDAAKMVSGATYDVTAGDSARNSS